MKNWFLEKINKMGKFLPRLIRKKKDTQINNIRNERDDITTQSTDIKRIIIEYYKQLSASKFDNLDEVDKFFERHLVQTECLCPLLKFLSWDLNPNVMVVGAGAMEGALVKRIKLKPS